MRTSVAVVAVAAALGVTGGTAVAVSQTGHTTAVVAGSAQATTSVPGGAPGVRTPRSSKHDRLREVLAGLVAKGTITQAQADAITTAMNGARAVHGPDTARGELGRVFGYLRNTEQVVADAIGITPQELRDELRSGSTLAEVAASHGVAESKVVDAVVSQATDLIDQAVSDGHLTAAQATKIKDGLRDMATKIVEGKGFGFGRPGRGERPRPGDHDTPPPTAPAPSVTPPTNGPTTAPAPTTAPPTTVAVTSAPSTTTD